MRDNNPAILNSFLPFKSHSLASEIDTISSNFQLCYSVILKDFWLQLKHPIQFSLRLPEVQASETHVPEFLPCPLVVLEHSPHSAIQNRAIDPEEVVVPTP